MTHHQVFFIYIIQVLARRKTRRTHEIRTNIHAPHKAATQYPASKNEAGSFNTPAKRIYAPQCKINVQTHIHHLLSSYTTSA